MKPKIRLDQKTIDRLRKMNDDFKKSAFALSASSLTAAEAFESFSLASKKMQGLVTKGE